MYRGSVPWFKVVRNISDDYAVWHADAEIASGWQETGRFGTADQCWDFIEGEEGCGGYLILNSNI